MAHGGSDKYYDPTNKVVYDTQVAEADDLNSINTAVDTAFAQVADDLDTLESATVGWKDDAEKWAEDPQGTNPDPLQPDKYSSKANAEEAEGWASGEGGVATEADGVTTITRSSKEYSEDAAADVVLTNADVVLTGLDVDATNANVVLTGLDVDATNADVILTGLDVDTTNADVVLTGLDVDDTNADVVSTNADVVLTGLDVDATNADVVLTGLDVVLTGLDVDSTNADVVSTNADVVLTGLDVVTTNADVVLTGLDVDTTNGDVVTTNADVVLADDAADRAEASASSISRKNLIINGNGVFNKRELAHFAPILSNEFMVDRFKCIFNIGTWLALNNLSSGVYLFGVHTQNPVTIADDEYITPVRQMIEGSNVAFMNPQETTITISFKAQSKVAGIHCVTLWVKDASTGGTTRKMLKEFTITSADTLESKVITLVVPAGYVANDVGTTSWSMIVDIGTLAGADTQGDPDIWYEDARRSTPNCVNWAGVTDGYFRATDIQVEVGSTASGFEQRTYGEELALCQRYYRNTYLEGVAPGASTYDGSIRVHYQEATTRTSMYVYVSYAVNMRETPTVILYNPQSGNGGEVRNLTDLTNPTVASILYSGEHGFSNFVMSVAADPGDIFAFHYTAEAEL